MAEDQTKPFRTMYLGIIPGHPGGNGLIRPTSDGEDDMAATNQDVSNGTFVREIFAEILFRAVRDGKFNTEHPVRSTGIRDIPIDLIMRHASASSTFHWLEKDQQKARAAMVLDIILKELKETVHGG